MQRTSRLFAARAINGHVIAPTGFAFEKRSAMFDKFFPRCFCRKLSFKLANALFQHNVLGFKVRHFLFKCCRLVSDERVLSVSVRNGKDRRRARCRVGLDALGAVSRTKRSAALDSFDSSMAATGPDRPWRPPCF